MLPFELCLFVLIHKIISLESLFQKAVLEDYYLLWMRGHQVQHLIDLIGNLDLDLLQQAVSAPVIAPDQAQGPVRRLVQNLVPGLVLDPVLLLYGLKMMVLTVLLLLPLLTPLPLLKLMFLMPLILLLRHQ